MSEASATRTAGLARLQAFLPRAGRDYTRLRNLDLPGHPHVSGLSPYLRHRLVTEAEVIAAVTALHGRSADKFLAEVWWRTYWKGWLELRPQVWSDYRRDLAAILNRLAVEPGLAAQASAAMQGDTGIDGFDHWARELASTGYLHNHARMWFASIWIFTLGLPWQLGADFFLRHLIDGDPASNTLGWRWVAGLHTPGKTYLATAENIALNTQGRFAPQGLARIAPAPATLAHPVPMPAPTPDLPDLSRPTLLLVTDDDLCPESLLPAGSPPQQIAALSGATGRSPRTVAPAVLAFTKAAIADTLQRCGQPEAPVFSADDLPALVQFAKTTGRVQIVTAYAPVGPVADAFAKLAPLAQARGLGFSLILRDHDRLAWPHATHGFFRFREAVMG
jgi:deoxyribodipyrimidine photo-lyase